MKIVKKELKKLKIKAVNYIKRIKKDHLIREFFKNNELFIIYFLVCIANSIRISDMTVEKKVEIISLLNIFQTAALI